MNRSSKKTTVTLEDLLQVKRAERPPVEFWGEFEREMRLKQLAAIVEPRPWWAPFIRIGTRVARYQVPVGAAAILALTFVTISDYRTGAIDPSLTIPESNLNRVAIVPSVMAESAAPVATVSAPVEEYSRPVPSEVSTLAASTDTGASSHVVPLPAIAVAVAEPSPSARAIAANLAAVRESDPSLVDDVFGRGVRGLQVREPVRDPLAQIASSRDTRRSRFLGTSLPQVATTNEVSAPGAERMARSLTEERLYDSISRVGVQGDRVAFKF